MKQEQQKILLMNIAKGGIIVIVILIGYFLFKDVKQGNENISGETTYLEETTIISDEIKSTVKTLTDLSGVVKDSVVIFETPDFKSLQNFSVSVPVEGVGRENPFITTTWKLNLEQIIEKSKESASLITPTSVGVTTITPVSSAPPQSI